jgi:hypothetical protein
VVNDIGAMELGRWQVSQLARRIGATSFVNVTVAPRFRASGGGGERRSGQERCRREPRDPPPISDVCHG